MPNFCNMLQYSYNFGTVQTKNGIWFIIIFIHLSLSSQLKYLFHLLLQSQIHHLHLHSPILFLLPSSLLLYSLFADSLFVVCQFVDLLFAGRQFAVQTQFHQFFKGFIDSLGFINGGLWVLTTASGWWLKVVLGSVSLKFGFFLWVFLLQSMGF